MMAQQWAMIEQAIVGMNADEKRAVAERILDSIRDDEAAAVERARRQKTALDGLCRDLDALPVAQDDGLSNRDHDRILYSS